MTCERCSHLHVPNGRVCDCDCHPNNILFTNDNTVEFSVDGTDSTANVTLKSDGTLS